MKNKVYIVGSTFDDYGNLYPDKIFAKKEKAFAFAKKSYENAMGYPVLDEEILTEYVEEWEVEE